MNTQIMGFSSLKFYNNQLQANILVANQLLLPGDQPFLFIDTAGAGFDERQEGTSTANPDEAGFVLKHLQRLADKFDESNFPSVAVISPYKEQIRELKAQLVGHPGLQRFQDKIDVNTIDSFQGQERDVVYISLTRSNGDGAIGFLSDYRRMNVAMTRARKNW